MGDQTKNLHRRLAALALALGALALFGDPYRGHVVTLDTRELAAIVQNEVDHVSAGELADWIIQGRSDVRLIDLRDPGAWAEYHIPTAESVPVAALPDYPLLRNERIVLYSGGGIHSAQAWFLLRAEGYRGVYMLLGGLAAWQDEILFPPAPAADDAEGLARFARAAEISRHFGGQPGTSGDEAQTAAPARLLPQVEVPSALPVAPPRKKSKEGC